MKGILKGIAGVFVEVDDKPVSKPKPPPSTKQVQAAVISVSRDTIGSVQSDEYQAFRDQFTAILADENKRNYPGNDYFEFVVMKNAMSAIAQENIKYQAAFAGWMTGGNQTKKSLLDTARVYLGLVDKEIKEFEEAYQHQYAGQVTNNEKLIEQKSKEQQELVDRINILNADIQKLKQENQDNTMKLKVKHESFLQAGEAQRREILDEIDKINQFIN